MDRELYKGTRTIYNEENDSRYTFTQTMIQNNIFIEEYTRLYQNTENEDEDYLATMINVVHQDTLGSAIVGSRIYNLYNGDELAPIQVHTIIKNLMELWNENSPRDFIELIEEMLSISIQSSSMQSQLGPSEDIMYGIKDRLDFIKSFDVEGETG